MMTTFTIDRLHVSVFGTRREMGRRAAEHTAAAIVRLLGQQPEMRMIFAAAPSQDEFLEALVSEPGIDWSRITAFHMDEYVGLPKTAPQLFSRYLDRHLFSKVPFAAVHTIDGAASSPAEECARYGALLKEKPVDIVCMGIGENGHIAFNDPPVADFNDPAVVKLVELDEACRRQQVNDGCFDRLDDVPTRALTLTVPALMGADALVVVVPGMRKAAAVEQSLCGDLSTRCPASILRTHRRSHLFLDGDAAASVLSRNVNSTNGHQ